MLIVLCFGGVGISYHTLEGQFSEGINAKNVEAGSPLNWCRMRHGRSEQRVNAVQYGLGN